MNLSFSCSGKSLTSAVLLWIFLLTGTIRAQEIHTYVDKDSLQVGDEFTLSVVLVGNYTLISYPDDAAFSDKLEMRNRSRYQVAAGRDSIVYNLQFFSLEDHTIPSLDFEIRTGEQDTTLQTSRVPLFFKTTLAEDDEELRPFKPIFDFARSYWPYLLALFLLGGIAYLIYRILKNRAKQEVFVPTWFERDRFVNPLDELEKTINQIESEPAPTNEKEFEQFYIRLGDAIRLYLKRVYKFPALEMTSGEIIKKLQELRASSDLIKKVRKVLYDADMVKFAKFNPASDQVADAIKTSVDFVETAKTIDTERIEYLKYLHNKEQDKLEEEHNLREQKRKEEFEQ